MKAPVIVKMAAAFGIAVTLGMARDAAHDGISASDLIQTVVDEPEWSEMNYASMSDILFK
jgi:F0F1-type ATP synthase membrane subunit c/vacuolar-type H+-ATPase subunit K